MEFRDDKNEIDIDFSVDDTYLHVSGQHDYEDDFDYDSREYILKYLGQWG